VLLLGLLGLQWHLENQMEKNVVAGECVEFVTCYASKKGASMDKTSIENTKWDTKSKGENADWDKRLKRKRRWG
jgi:hypothetical protein